MATLSPQQRAAQIQNARYAGTTTTSAPPKPGFFTKNVINPIKSAFGGGVQQIGQGISDAANAKNLGQFGHSIGELGSGAAGVVSSPLAPIINPTVGAGTNFLADKISNNSTVQNFANSKAGHITSDVAENVGNFANIVGTVGGGMQAYDAIHPIFQRTMPLMNPSDLVESRTATATPTLEQVKAREGGITGNTMNPEGKIVPRVEEGTGLTGKQTVTTNKFEAEQGKELANLKDFPDKGTKLEQSQAVGRGINTEAENMRSGLQAEDKANPLNAQAEKAKIADLVKSNLPKEIQDKIGYVSKDSPLAKMGAKDAPQTELNKSYMAMTATEENLPKTAAGRYYSKVLDEIKNYDGTREGKLNLRQNIDTAYENARGKLAWGSDSQNALDEVNTSIRDDLNKDLGDTTKNSDTQASLKKQTNLYRAKKTIDWEANHDASSEIGRFFQNHPILHRLATREALKFMATATGTGILASYITKKLQGK